MSCSARWLVSEGMESNERAELERLLFGLAARIDLPAREKRAMLADFRAAAEYLVSDGVPAREAAERLGCERLGDFYLRRADYWYPLDDAAKIYPMSMTDGWMSVFRLSAYMDAPVVPELLQAALHFVLPRFPFFSTEVRRGLFWHYIDGVKRRFVVRPETEPPCAPMDLTAGERQAFRVVYYRERISVEFFHILTDGTGGLAFLTALVSEYLRLLGLSDGQDAPAETPPDGEECENAFERCCGEAPCGGFAERPAVQLRGRLSKQRPARVLHLELDATVLRGAAKARGATVTALVLAFIAEAAHAASEPSRGEIRIQVPVNMRKFRPSATLRNFSMYCSVAAPWEEAGDAARLTGEFARQLRDKASERAMLGMLGTTAAMVRRLSPVPLAVKRPAARLAYGFLGERAFTCTLSNLGAAVLPEDAARHVVKLDFVLGTCEQSRAACSMVTLGDRAVLTVTKLTEDPAFENRLTELFEVAGVPVRLSGSMLYGA